jgi:hypothetical protein
VLLTKNDTDNYITKTVEEILIKISEYMKGRSGWKILSIDAISIEVYTYHCAEGGSYIPTPKILANKKCTINLDNRGLIDSDTGLPFEKCLQGALDAYFARALIGFSNY